MSAVNELIDNKLGGFEEVEIYQISLTEEGYSYLKNGLPERQLLNFMLKDNTKEINLDKFLKNSKLDKSIFYIGISNLKKNKWVAQSRATGEDKIYLIVDKFPQTKLEAFLTEFKENKVIDHSSLSNDDLKLVDSLNKRKLIKKTRKTQRIIYLTDKGKKHFGIK